MNQLSYLRQSVLQSIRTLKDEIQPRKAQYQKRLEPIESKLNQLPANDRQLLQIMRQQQIKEQLFLYLLEKGKKPPFL
jgi:tyrosine-protein kinase Etk/Wzc